MHLDILPLTKLILMRDFTVYGILHFQIEKYM